MLKTIPDILTSPGASGVSWGINEEALKDAVQVDTHDGPRIAARAVIEQEKALGRGTKEDRPRRWSSCT